MHPHWKVECWKYEALLAFLGMVIKGWLACLAATVAVLLGLA